MCSFIFCISMFQCWTAAPSSLPFKSFCWSTSSCVDSSRATRPLHYRRYIVCVSMVIFLSLVVFYMWQCEKDVDQQSPAALRALFCSMSQKWICMLQWACESKHWLSVLSIQISQVCQLCQQSPRLFTNHAAQLHTLLVSIFSLNPL